MPIEEGGDEAGVFKLDVGGRFFVVVTAARHLKALADEAQVLPLVQAFRAPQSFAANGE